MPCCCDRGVAESTFPQASLLVSGAVDNVKKSTEVTPADVPRPLKVLPLPVNPSTLVTEAGAFVMKMVVLPAARCAVVPTVPVTRAVVVGLDSTYKTPPE